MEGGAADETTAEAGHGFAHDSQPAGQVTGAWVGATPEVMAPAGHGLAQVSQPAGQVTAVSQFPGAAAEVGSGADVMEGSEEESHCAADGVWRSARVIKASMLWEVVCCMAAMGSMCGMGICLWDEQCVRSKSLHVKNA